nr:uncharacterized protein LOC104121241 isoform X2 [Nicotiana tomentosiformis]
MGSNFCRQKLVSDDDEIDYSVKPEFYDPELNDKDELWVQKKRGGRTSDAILNCPACFTTLCLDYQSRLGKIMSSLQHGGCQFFTRTIEGTSSEQEIGKKERQVESLLLREQPEIFDFFESELEY